MLAFLCLILQLSNAIAYASGTRGKHIIILAGQSNMSGRGGVQNNTWDGVVPLQSQPNPTIFRLTADLSWIEARDPLHKDIDVNATCGLGPGMSFANRLLQRAPGLGPLGLVPCAVGGPRGTKSARESDTVNELDARMYGRRLINLFNNLRADLGSPLLPIVQVAITSGQGPYVETVRKAQLGIKLQKTRCVDSKGLPLLPDNLHLSTRAQVRLGRMLANAFLKVL
ncbi:hypothetical protein L2E82_17584 [Cichorium intybus]|uniref:Uncharacterized protein n=1 Tax=Cichorium intybus TaxID=13427 RepID=A0ACB9F9V9_CICIN|nr:hypothetical protein L2E82_17584 [Cichorium intybus]